MQHPTENKLVITVNHYTDGPLIEGQISDRPTKISLDKEAMVNVIGLKELNKIKPGVKVIGELPYSLQGVTGDLLNTLGITQVTVTIIGYFNFDIFAIVVENQHF